MFSRLRCLHSRRVKLVVSRWPLPDFESSLAARDVDELMSQYDYNRLLRENIPRPHFFVFPTQVRNKSLFPISTKEHHLRHHVCLAWRFMSIDHLVVKRAHTQKDIFIYVICRVIKFYKTLVKVMKKILFLLVLCKLIYYFAVDH